MGDQSPAEFDPELAALIKHKVSRVVGRYGFISSDVQDLEQELYLQTFESMGRHDSQRASRRTYADHLVASKLATIIEQRSARKRDWKRHGQLGERDAGIADHRTAEDSDLRVKLCETVKSLDPELQGWAALFTNFTEAETIRLTGLSRGKVREMRRRLEDALRLGLDPEKKSTPNNQSARGSGR